MLLNTPGAKLTLDSSLVRRDGGTFDSHVVLLSGQSGVDGDLVVGLVAVGQTQVEVLELHVDVRQDELRTDRTSLV